MDLSFSLPRQEGVNLRTHLSDLPERGSRYLTAACQGMRSLLPAE